MRVSMRVWTDFEMEADGFQLVRRGDRRCARSKSARKGTKPIGMSPEPLEYRALDENVEEYVNRFRRRRELVIDVVERIGFFRELVETVHDVKRVIGLGLGRLDKGNGLYQLVLLELVVREIRKQNPECMVSLYDPAHGAGDRAIVEGELGFEVSPNDFDQGRKAVVLERTLFFMFHCSLRLYSNVLWANWSNLEHMIILGNSFQSYDERIMDKSLRQDPSNCVLLVCPYVKEKKLGLTTSELVEFEQAFGDTSILSFPDSNRARLASAIPDRPVQFEGEIDC